VTCVLSFSSISFSPPPSDSPISMRSSLVSTNSLPSVYRMKPCLASFRKNTSDIAEHRTMDLGSVSLAILLMFLSSRSQFSVTIKFNPLRLTYLVCIRVIDFVERNDCGKLLVREGVDDLADSLVRPVFKGLLQSQSVQTSCHDLGRTAVPGELVLQRFHSSCFWKERYLPFIRSTSGTILIAICLLFIEPLNRSALPNLQV